MIGHHCVKGGILMSDMWKILRQNIERTRPKSSNHQDISQFLKGEEETNYAKRLEEGKLRKSTTDEPLDDFKIGEEKDKTDYLREFPKLQMKELNSMNESQQTKHLKQEYNRLYDRMLEMNDKLSDHEKDIMDLQMTKRLNEKEVQKMKTLIRTIVYMFPGGSKVKPIIDTSGWKTEDVEVDIIHLINEVLGRVKNVDNIIQQETKIIQEENRLLKQEVVRLQAQVLRIDELERMILSNAQNFVPSESTTPITLDKDADPTPAIPLEKSPDTEPKPFVTPFIFPKIEKDEPSIPTPPPAVRKPIFPETTEQVGS